MNDQLNIPHSIDAEQSLLAALMLDPSTLAKVGDWLEERDFYRRDHQAIYRAIAELSKRAGAAVDPVTMADWFEANDLAHLLPGSGYLIEIASGPGSPANAVAYAEIVAEKAKLRRAIETGQRLITAASEPRANAAEIIGGAVHALSNMATERRGGLEGIKTTLQRIHAQMVERYEHPVDNRLLGLPTPWKDVNDLTHGLRDGALYILGARPSMGKSLLAGQLAAFTALRRNRTAWFSVEMTAEECMQRAIACISGVPHEWVEQPDRRDPEQDEKWAKITSASTALLESPLLIDDTPSLTIRQLQARARRAHQQQPLRLIVIDHAHDMKIDPQHARFEYGAIAQGAKDLAKEFRCPVVLLAQLNRNVSNRADKRPTLTDLRESGEFEQKGDVILFAHREDYYDPNAMPGVIELIPAKGRNIQVGRRPIYLQNDYQRMRALDWKGPLPQRNESRDGFRRSAA